MQSAPTRRSVLVATASVVLPLAGCLGGGPGQRGPREREFTLTLTRDGETVEARIEPAGEVADVIQIRVGDTVEFTVRNEAGVPVGVHNHADDAEVVLDPGEDHLMSFEAIEAMTGRQEVEGWVAESGPTDDEGNGGHGAGVTTLAVIEVRPRGG